jgi:pimeloyl-ACP methyl ester carboxylesterase
MTTLTEAGATSVGPSKTYTVRGGGGLALHVREWGNPNGIPILFLHGWSQSHQSWVRQYNSDLADGFRLVACDLRGHGMSESPTDAQHYAQGQRWADDVAAMIGELDLDRPVLVGWSYGGFVIGDYVRAYGQDRIRAVNLVGGAVQLGGAAFGSTIGPGFTDNFGDAISEDLPTSIRGLRGLTRALTVAPLPSEETETLLSVMMVVPAAVRGHLGARQLDYDDVLSTLRVPVLVSHGRDDTVVLPAMAEHVLAVCPTAEVSWYDRTAHSPHLEQPARFNRELAELADRTA